MEEVVAPSHEDLASCHDDDHNDDHDDDDHGDNDDNDSVEALHQKKRSYMDFSIAQKRSKESVVARRTKKRGQVFRGIK